MRRWSQPRTGLLNADHDLPTPLRHSFDASPRSSWGRGTFFVQYESGLKGWSLKTLSFSSSVLRSTSAVMSARASVVHPPQLPILTFQLKSSTCKHTSVVSFRCVQESSAPTESTSKLKPPARPPWFTPSLQSQRASAPALREDAPA